MLFFSPVLSVAQLDEIEGNVLLFIRLNENGNRTWPEVAALMRGASDLPSNCSTRTAAASCLKSKEAEMGRRRIVSDRLRFFKIDFLWSEEFELDIRLLPYGEVLAIHDTSSDPVCSGPYSQVTSQSFCLVNINNDALIFDCHKRVSVGLILAN
jgi:hypothetical protein